MEDLAEKESVLAEGRRGFFTIPHFDGYAAVLVQLNIVATTRLQRGIVDAWLARAPEALGRRHFPA